MLSDTIAAISTAPGESAISVIRLSGPKALAIAASVFKLPNKVIPRHVHLASVLDENGAKIDSGVLLHFQGPASYSGEDVIEFQGHGGVLVTQRVLERLLACGARPAEAGEFTQRAFLNGKMDLTQAEAVMDLIHAQSTLALRAANEQLQGAIGREAEHMQQMLVPVLAHIEAYIDFPDEDISPETGADLLRRIDAVQSQASQLLATAEQGRILRHGARTVISGAPNVGKSSLLNLLLGFERAIVSSTAGTTRDTIEEIIQVHGIPLRLVDTAGLRDSQDAIERIGIERTQREIERADLILEVFDGSQPPSTTPKLEVPTALLDRHLIILNKTDLGTHPAWGRHKNAIRISCVQNEGIKALRDAIREIITKAGSLASDHPIAINARHQAAFQRSVDRLTAARAAIESQKEPEFIALELRESLQALGDVIGQVDVEQILDVIFSTFCIGK
ncbi:MAG: tRNA uridine-5-carboxymethylaminomethyl(34) synthesis GTPase MnmE [Prosthecobacter sp.]